MHLRGEPRLVEIRVRAWFPIRVPLNNVRNSQTPFTHDGWGVAVTVVVPSVADVAIVRDLDARKITQY